jgi:hypothetical protein
MPGETYGNVIVCGPPRGVYKRVGSRRCPECQDAHGFVDRWDGAWYGFTEFGSCGDWWQDGYRARRPFARYWRRDAQRQFQAMWDNAADADLFDAYIEADSQAASAAYDDEASLAAWERRDEIHRQILAAREVA